MGENEILIHHDMCLGASRILVPYFRLKKDAKFVAESRIVKAGPAPSLYLLLEELNWRWRIERVWLLSNQF